MKVIISLRSRELVSLPIVIANIWVLLVTYSLVSRHFGPIGCSVADPEGAQEVRSNLPPRPLFLVVVFLLGLLLNVPVNTYTHVGTVSSPNHNFFPGQDWTSG